jgi:hypothetical protein
MPSPEYHYHRCAEPPIPASPLQAVITDLAAYHEVDLAPTGVSFTVDRPEQGTRWMITNLDGERMDVARCPFADDPFMVPDLDVTVALTPTGWHTTSVVYTAAVWEAYAKTIEAQGQPPVETTAPFPFGSFAAYVAQLLEEELQLEQTQDAQAVQALLTSE